MQRPAPNIVGDRAWSSTPKISAEFFALTYGTFVHSLVQDAGGLGPATSPLPMDDRAAKVNQQLSQMGKRIGFRIIDEYLAKTPQAPPCKGFVATAEAIAKVGLRVFLGITAQVSDVVEAGSAGKQSPAAYSLSFEENPLNGFTELPDALKQRLWYSNVLCGVIEGALEQVGIHCTAAFTKCVLRGDQVHEIRVTQVMKGGQE